MLGNFQFLASGATFNKKKLAKAKQILGRDKSSTLSRSTFVATKTDTTLPVISYDDITPEQEARWLNHHRITVKNWSMDAIGPTMKSFSELETRFNAPKLLTAVAEQGWTAPSKVQQGAIPALMAGRDLIALGPTGSGKTGAFLLPLLAKLGGPKAEGFRALIMAPTRELCEQISRTASMLAPKLRVMFLHGSRAQKQSLTSTKRHDLLVSTPLVMLNLANEGTLKLGNVKHIVLDECDALMSEQFRPQTDAVLGLLDSQRRGGTLQTALFSASFNDEVSYLVQTFLLDPVRVSDRLANMPTEHVKQEFVYTGTEQWKSFSLSEALRKHRPPALIFVQTADRAAQLHRQMALDSDRPVGSLHSGLKRARRIEVASQFRSGKLYALICTDVAARGLDFKGITLVVNYDVPTSMVTYLHRVGRAGRQREGTAITLFTDGDTGLIPPIANAVRSTGQEVPEWLLSLPRMSQTQRKRMRTKPMDRGTAGPLRHRRPNRDWDLAKVGIKARPRPEKRARSSEPQKGPSKKRVKR
eukprot:gnl/Dysnectes_brevis/2116_a2458_696.p1 GENE.gnl/Dysnectes_brevis/2116_a2458_696~~gnl/Dysnectes_brevis/2116_a2458_696.p1  ORF type:complete len:529 (-),score=163.29 gnl/Dysnectes_brevis/2116_a2458_696:54-1640(-)